MKTYPIAETFTSVQGEGVYTGTLMHFIRLAGCNVGQYVTPDASGGISVENIPASMVHNDDFILLRDRHHSVCESAVGQRFLCDTNYHKCYDATAQELMEKAGLVEHVCITGGEPFLHDLSDLLEYAAQREVHIETSGTKPIFPMLEGLAWFTCSPKRGFLSENVPLINEWKFVVSNPADVRRVALFVEEHAIPDTAPIYLQPVNWVNTINSDCIDMVLAELEHYPTFRLSAQLHKYLGVR